MAPVLRRTHARTASGFTATAARARVPARAVPVASTRTAATTGAAAPTRSRAPAASIVQARALPAMAPVLRRTHARTASGFPATAARARVPARAVPVASTRTAATTGAAAPT